MAQGNTDRNEDQGQQLVRPNRRDFQIHVVLAPNGQIVDPKEWQGVLGQTQGRERRSLLKENGWTEAKTFNQEEYDAAVKDFREQSRNNNTTQRKNLFARIYDEAAVDPHPRLESALRTLMGSLDNSNPRRMEKALVNVCIAVDGLLKPMQRGGRRNQEDDQKNDRQRPNMDKVREMNAGSAPGGSSKDHPGAETTEDGRRINQDGSIDKRTKPEGGISEATAKARGQDVDDEDQGQQRQARRSTDDQGSEPGGNSTKHPGAETDEHGHRINQDGSVDKRTKGDDEDKAQGQKTREEHGLQGTTKAEAGVEDDNTNSGPGHSRGESGEGGELPDGRKLRKDGEVDKRTKPDDGISEATAKARGQDTNDQSSGKTDLTEEQQLQMLDRIKQQYDEAVEEATADKDVQQLASLKELYDTAIDQVMSGQKVDDMFKVKAGGQAKSQAKNDDSDDHSGTDGVRSKEKEDADGNFVPKAERNNGGNGARA